MTCSSLRAQIEKNVKELQSFNEEIEKKTDVLEMTLSDEMAHSIQGDVITMENHLR